MKSFWPRVLIWIPCSKRAPSSLFASAKRVQTLGQGALAAGEHRSVAQREATRLGFAQLLHQIEKVRRLIRLKNDDKLLIVQTERISRVQFYRAILRADADILVHHILTLLLRPRVPFGGALQRTNQQILGLA